MSHKIKMIENFNINESLMNETRQYLVGKLGRPQNLEHIEDEKIEIGITSYDDFYSESPHTHSKSYEYQYMLNGYTKYLDIDTGDEYVFKKGDFYRITPGMKYAQKSKPGTQILFIKSPSGNDKIDIESDEVVSKWLSQKIKTIRNDYYFQDNNPKPNSIRPAASVAIIEGGKILMLHRVDNDKWTLPGGTHEIGESIGECAIREFKEETGFEIELTGIIGTYTSPEILIEYSDGEIRQEFTIVFAGRKLSGDIKIDNESKEYEWVSDLSLT